METTNHKNHLIQNPFLNDKFIFFLIVINSILIFCEGFKELGASASFYISLIDSTITLAFAVEALVKINHFGWKIYIKSGWNQLDLILIIISLPSIFLIILHSSFQGFSFLLILRVLRVFKFLRFFKFIPGVEQLVIGIKRALKASIFVLFGLFIFNFMISVLSCYLFKDASPEYFGNPVKSMYSIFRISTTEGWYELPDKISKNSDVINSFFVKGFFIVVLLIGGILGLSLVNSIFVDSMVMDNNDALEKKVDELNEKIEILIKNQVTNKQSNPD
jgi:voltage-gated sodium channel